MDVVDTLIKARELLLDPTKWGKGYLARNVNGKGIENPIGPDACQWCALGAICFAARSRWYPEDAREYLIRALESKFDVTWIGVANYNDALDTKHEDIISLYDEAIVLALNEQENNEYT